MSVRISNRITLRFLSLGAVLMAILSYAFTYTLRVDADYIILESVLTETKVEVSPDATFPLPHELHEYTWSSFDENVPEGSSITGIDLILSWEHEEVPLESAVPEAEVEDQEAPPAATDIELMMPPAPEILPETSESDEDTENREESIQDESGTAEAEPVDDETIPADTELPPEVVGFKQVPHRLSFPFVQESITTNSETEEPADSSVDESGASSNVDTEIVMTEPTTDEADVVTVVTVDEEGQPEDVVPFEVVQIDTIGVEEILPPTEPPILPSEDSFPLITSETVSSTPHYPTQDAAEIQYSLGADMWTTLGTVDLVKNREVVLDMSMLTPAEILSLHVRLVYLAPLDAPRIMFKNPQLRLTYTPLAVEMIPVGPSDQEPNFNNGVVRVDSSSENIRAVVLELGGMLEFWYSVTNARSGEEVWRKLSGGGAIQEGAPIGIKKRTIFWFDRNQEMLFGLSVDTESIFGVPYDNPLERTFRLPFETEDEEHWQAVYEPQENVLNFEKVRKVSPR